MRDALLNQTALYVALHDAVFISGRGDPIPVVDEAPPGTVAPYIVIGESTDEPADTHDGLGSIETAMLHTFSRAKGASECKAVMAATDRLLHQRTLEIEDGRYVRVTREFAEVLTEDEPGGERWRHGIMRVRIRTLNLLPLDEDEYA